MKFTLTVRHFEPAEEFRGFVEEKVKACVEKYFPRALESHITVSMEGRRYIAEVDISVRGTSFHASGEMRNLHRVIEVVMDKLETQMRRGKAKRRNHKQHGPGISDQELV